MKQRLLIGLFMICCSAVAPAQDKLYIWSEVEPGWKNRSLRHWEDISGYGKKVPSEMSGRIEEYSSLVAKKLELTLTELILGSELPVTVELTKNPGALALGKNDLFLDLQCSILEVSDIYPYYRVRKIGIEPFVRYSMSLYDSRGTVILQGVYSDSIDYSSDIRPLLRGMPEHQRDVEIFKNSFLESFSGPLPDSILRTFARAAASSRSAGGEADQDRFRQVLGLVFENRKVRYPGDYSDIHFARQAPREENRKNDLKQDSGSALQSSTARELAELTKGTNYYALLIGINEYADPSINNLSEPLADARRLKEVLVSRYTFEDEHVVLLENPSRDQIIQSFDKLAYELTGNDNLLIFYAGHGIWDDQLKKGFWIPSDARTDNRANWFSNSDLRDYIGGIPAKHTLLISDACFSGGIFKTREVFTYVSPATVELYRLPSRKAMTSGTMTTVPDRSVFIEYLIRRLEDNSSYFLSTEQLFSSFKLAVINNSPTKQVPQFGEIRETGDEGGDFLFILRMEREEAL